MKLNKYQFSLKFDIKDVPLWDHNQSKQEFLYGSFLKFSKEQEWLELTSFNFDLKNETCHIKFEMPVSFKSDYQTINASIEKFVTDLIGYDNVKFINLDNYKDLISVYSEKWISDFSISLQNAITTSMVIEDLMCRLNRFPFSKHLFKFYSWEYKRQEE